MKQSVILYLATSLDGFIAKTDGDVDWLDAFDDGKEDYGFGDLIARVGANIQGANTYEQVRKLDIPWPYETKSYVLSSKTLPLPEKGEVEFFNGDLPALVKKVRENHQKDIWLIGGGKAAQSLLNESLVDEIILSVLPVLLGSGIPLFGTNGTPSDLRLKDTKQYESGVVNLYYEIDTK